VTFELVEKTVFKTEKIELALGGVFGPDEFDENKHDDR
jgi:hypothetical protein